MRTLFSAGTIDRIKLVSRRRTSTSKNESQPSPFDLPPIYEQLFDRIWQFVLSIFHVFLCFLCYASRGERERESFITFCINDRGLFRGEEGISEIGDSNGVFRGFSMIFIEHFRGEKKKKRTRWLDPVGKSAAGPGGACARAPFTDTPRELDPTPPPPLVETAFLAFFPC